MENTALVFDPGSSRFKAGFAGDMAPHAVFRSLVGCMSWHLGGEMIFSEDAWGKRGVAKQRYPINDDGTVIAWDLMGALLHHTFYEELCVAPEEHSVLLTEPPMNPLENRQKMAEMMFELFRVPSLQFANSAGLTLHASGLNTGIVYDSGHKMTRIIPICQGSILSPGYRHFDFAGENLSNLLRLKLMERGYPFTTSAERVMVRDIQAKFCYVTLDYKTSLRESTRSSPLTASYELPDGEIITFTDELFNIPEAIFQPSFLNSEFAPVDPETPGIHQAIHESIQKCDANLHRDLYSNVVLSGGNIMFPGISARLQKELSLLAPPGTEIGVVAPPDRIYSSWIGGSMLASAPTFKNQWCSKQQYEEFGSSVIHRKCL